MSLRHRVFANLAAQLVAEAVTARLRAGAEAPRLNTSVAASHRLQSAVYAERRGGAAAAAPQCLNTWALAVQLSAHAVSRTRARPRRSACYDLPHSMPVFISYSHTDGEFVDRLAAELIRARKPVWVDRYELRAGDSLISRIQDEITRAGAMLVVLSRASVNSEWCKKELSAGLVRELEEKRVVVIPVLVEDCPIPIFLRDKRYADFRADFDKGLSEILEAVASVTNDRQGRVQSDGYDFDWAIDWTEADDPLHLRIIIVEHYRTPPVTGLTTISVACNDLATRRYRIFDREGFGSVGRGVILEALAEFAAKEELFLLLEDQHEKSFDFGIKDDKKGIRLEVHVTSRRLGEDTGKDLLVSISGQLSTVRDSARASTAKLPPEDTQRLFALLLALNAG
jgi:hypothetical protein